jgi:hypothetical protein
MGRILVHDFRHLSHSSGLGRTRPNRRVDISPLRWVLQMKNKKDTQQLATLVYVLAMRKEIEKEVESRYSKRIEYLVGANNELMKELEHWENEIITVSKESAVDIEEGGVDDGDGIEKATNVANC